MQRHLFSTGRKAPRLSSALGATIALAAMWTCSLACGQDLDRRWLGDLSPRSDNAPVISDLHAVRWPDQRAANWTGNAYAAPWAGDQRVARWAGDVQFGRERIVPAGWDDIPTPLSDVDAWAPEMAFSADAVPPPPSAPGNGEPPSAVLGDLLPPGQQPAAAATAPAAGTEEQPLGKAPEDTRLLFLRSATVLLAPGQWQFDWGLQYTMDEAFRPIVLPDFGLGEDRFRLRRAYVPFALRVGVTERLQAFCNAPLGVGWMEYTNGVVTTHDAVFGLNDLMVGFNYLLRRGDAHCPDIVVTADMNMPTGPLPYKADLTRAYLSDGFWSAGVNLLCIHTYDPVVVFYGIGYRHRFERGYLGGTLTPGEEVNYNFGTGFAINDRVTLSTALLGAFQPEYEFNDVGIPGSSQEPISLRMALTAFVGQCHIVEPFVIFGLTRDATDAQLGLIITRTF